MGFTPIPLKEYAQRHVKANPGDKEREVIASLERALRDFQRGVRCACGEPIWVIGSSVVGNSCFTCITGSTDNSEDYEVAEAFRPATLP